MSTWLSISSKYLSNELIKTPHALSLIHACDPLDFFLNRAVTYDDGDGFRGWKNKH